MRGRSGVTDEGLEDEGSEGAGGGSSGEGNGNKDQRPFLPRVMIEDTHRERGVWTSRYLFTVFAMDRSCSKIDK